MLSQIATIVDYNEIRLPTIRAEEKTDFEAYYDEKERQWSRLTFYSITYLSDGLKVKGYLILPKNLKTEKKIPCLIYNRGGSGEFGVIGEKKLFYDLTDLAALGLAVIASQYRGNGGSEGLDEYCGSDINDVLNLKGIIDSMPIIDSSNVAMFGASRGGLMTYKSLAEVDWIKCAIIKAGSTDEIRGYKQRPELLEFRKKMYDVTSENENIKRSPLKWTDEYIRQISSPILLLHGTEDSQVDVLDTIEMSLRLINNKVPFEMHIYDGDDHRLRKNKFKVNSLIKAWLDRYLSLS